MFFSKWPNAKRFALLSAIFFALFSLILWHDLHTYGSAGFSVAQRVSAFVFYPSYLLGVMLHFYFKKNTHLSDAPSRMILMTTRVICVCLYVFTS